RHVGAKWTIVGRRWELRLCLGERANGRVGVAARERQHAVHEQDASFLPLARQGVGSRSQQLQRARRLLTVTEPRVAFDNQRETVPFRTPAGGILERALRLVERMRILIHRHLNLRSRIPGERALCRTAGPLRYYGRLQQPKSFGESPAQYRVDSENLVSQKAGKGIARTRQFPAVCIC